MFLLSFSTFFLLNIAFNLIFVGFYGNKTNVTCVNNRGELAFSEGGAGRGILDGF